MNIVKSQKQILKLNFIIFIFQIFLGSKMINCDCIKSTPFLREGGCTSNYCSDSELTSNSCSINNTIIKTQWLNDIIIFHNGTKFRAGSLALNSNMDMIIEYSDNNKRIFYGLKNDGTYFLMEIR